MSCDAGIVHWLENGAGEPLSVGRKTRSVPPAIRRALQRRDGGCRFPGCSCSRFVDAHHIRHWADGGQTSSGIEITPDTTVTLWRGERMDEQMAVEGLLRRK